MSTEVAAAYDATGGAWARGPGRLYSALADVVCERCPVPLAGALMLDLGAGTGAGSAAGRRQGARPVAVDVAFGMLAGWAGERPPAAVGDMVALPFRPASFDAVVAAFSVNHVRPPGAGLRESVRVLRPGGGLVVSAYAEGEAHPVKAATDAAAEARGWRTPAWHRHLQEEVVPLLATVDRAVAVAEEAGLAGASVARVDVPFRDLTARELVAWRLGMAHLAPFVASLSDRDRRRLVADAVSRLGPDVPVLVRSIIVLAWQRPGGGGPTAGSARSTADAGARQPAGSAG